MNFWQLVGWGKLGWASFWPCGPSTSSSGQKNPSMPTVKKVSNYYFFSPKKIRYVPLSYLSPLWFHTFWHKQKLVPVWRKFPEPRRIWDRLRKATHGAFHRHSYKTYHIHFRPRGWKIHWHDNTAGQFLLPVFLWLKNRFRNGQPIIILLYLRTYSRTPHSTLNG